MSRTQSSSQKTHSSLDETSLKEDGLDEVFSSDPLEEVRSEEQVGSGDVSRLSDDPPGKSSSDLGDRVSLLQDTLKKQAGLSPRELALFSEENLQHIKDTKRLSPSMKKGISKRLDLDEVTALSQETGLISKRLRQLSDRNLTQLLQDAFREELLSRTTDTEHQDAIRDRADPDNKRVYQQGNQFDDQLNVWEKLLAWRDGTPTTLYDFQGNNVQALVSDQYAMYLFAEATQQHRRYVFKGFSGILEKMFTVLSEADMARILNLCDFKLEQRIQNWYVDFIQPRANSRQLMQKMIFNASLSERLTVCQDESLVALLQADFSQDHPENLFGDAIREQLYSDEATQAAFDARHPGFAKWRGTADKLDAEDLWAKLGEGTADAIKELKATGEWETLLASSPRGAALSASMRENIDTIVGDGSVKPADRRSIFEIRFNSPLEVDYSMSTEEFQIVWDALSRLPVHAVSSDTISLFYLEHGASAGGTYTNATYSDEFGKITGEFSYWGDPEVMDHIQLHEVGHSQDTRMSGFTKLSSKNPISWRKWRTEDPWLESLSTAAGGPTGDEGAALISLLSAARTATTFTSPFGNWTGDDVETPERQKTLLWTQVETLSQAGKTVEALQELKDASKLSADPTAISEAMTLASANDYPKTEPAYIGDEFYLMKYNQFFAYDRAGASDVWARNGKANISAWTLCSPYEFYADMYSAFYDPNGKKDENLPGWAGKHFRKMNRKLDREGKPPRKTSD